MPPIPMKHLLVAEKACHDALATPELRRIGEQLSNLTIDAWAELEKVTVHPESTAHLKALVNSIGEDSIEIVRWFLLRASLAALPRIPSWRVIPSVKGLWADDVLYYARPSGDLSVFSLDNVRFREMARIATLRRYPAGQFHWEISGLPRSWVLRTHPSRWPALLSTLCLRTRGFAPMAETHLNDRRRNRLSLTESEGVRSYYRLARSLELQPEIKGLVTCSWLYCATTAEITPRLAWLRRFFLDQGAFVASIGPAPPESGFLVGSEERRQLYEEGRYRPLATFVLWPRKAILDWARTVVLDDE